MNSKPTILSHDGEASEAVLSHLFPEAGDSSQLKVHCKRTDYSASHLSRAIEDAEAHVLNLNITDEVPFEGGLTVEVRISHRNPSAAARSLERYGYAVGQTSCPDITTELTRRRINEFMAHLDV